MHVKAIDYWLARLAATNRHALWTLGNIESYAYRKEIASVIIDRPIFITGLARSGSTMLLELLNRQPGLVSHRYCDFPFLTVPIVWNCFLNRAAAKVSPAIPRAHRDQIRITPDSPEGMEEILWQRYSAGANGTTEPRFLRFYQEHVKKLLWLRGGTRYVAKNNFHLDRIPALLKIFPDAQFVIPIRHPIAHVQSLVSQHARFCEYAQLDKRTAFMMATAGHYEFGPQRSARRITAGCTEEIEQSWAAGDNVTGYALLWAAVYERVLQWLNCAELGRSMVIVSYEEFCSQPELEWRRLSAALSLNESEIALDHVVAPAISQMSPADEHRIWSLTERVARGLHLSPNPNPTC